MSKKDRVKEIKKQLKHLESKLNQTDKIGEKEYAQIKEKIYALDRELSRLEIDNHYE